MTLFPAVLDALKARSGGDILVFGGGIVPDEDAVELAQLGVAAIFKPGASTDAIVKWVEEHVRPRVEAA
jgi:methylmalonyl-CoA mutase C-terminal domain/subunit